jgi:hypothetical protein
MAKAVAPKAVAPVAVTPEAAAPAEETPAKPAKAPKRFWYLVDESGERIERDGKMPKIHGKNPFQAVQKAVTRYATDLGKEYEFMLREAKGKPTKAGKLRVYKYKGWKTELADGEGSEFTKNHSITSKPHAKSLGVTLIDAPVKPTKAKKVKASPEQATEEEVKPATDAPKRKRAGKAKASPEEKTEAAPEPPKKKRAGKGKASPEEKAQ